MRPTITYIKEKFDYYNKLCFEGKLPMPSIKLNTRYATMGITKVHVRRLSNGNIIKDIYIEISNRQDLPEEEYIDTLVHEMIHYYIEYNGLQDNSMHGNLFLAKMNEIISRFGIKVTLAFTPTDEQLVNKKSRWRYVCVIDFDNEKIGIAVVAKNKVFEFWRTYPTISGIRNVKWYASNRAIFENYPVAVSIGWNYVDADKLYHYLSGAVELENTGNIIRKKQVID